MEQTVVKLFKFIRALEQNLKMNVKKEVICVTLKYSQKTHNLYLSHLSKTHFQHATS